MGEEKGDLSNRIDDLEKRIKVLEERIAKLEPVELMVPDDDRIRKLMGEADLIEGTNTPIGNVPLNKGWRNVGLSASEAFVMRSVMGKLFGKGTLQQDSGLGSSERI